MFSSMSLEIIFEDDSLIIINKPSGVVVNISETSPKGTVQNVLQERLKIDSQDRSEFAQRAGIVHRIDKGTSGVLVIAKSRDAFTHIKNQFKTRKVRKEYLAIVLGEVKDPVFEVNAPIKRNPRNRVRMAIVKDGRPAVTRFELVRTVRVKEVPVSVLKCYPETGRTHQIRVHLSAVKHPIMGDLVYLTKKQIKETESIFKRLMLHAWKISFNHPKIDKELFFEAPLPAQLEKICSKSH